VYGAFSLYFAHTFFPAGNRTAQLLSTAAVFAFGFLVRPIGGWLLGRYADRRGRRAALSLAVLLMCAGSLLIALTPGYAQIGIAAPALLLVARTLQGFSVGGEYGTSATYLSEVAPPARRGFYTSFQYVTLIMGQLLAISVLLVLQFVLLTPSELAAWGWRVPFVIGALCAAVALQLRSRLAESSTFVRSSAARDGAGELAVLARYPREALLVMCLTVGGTIAFYTFTTYMQTFLVNTSGLSYRDSTLVSAASLFCYMLLQPLAGALSDRLGRRPLLISFGVLGTLGTVPLLKGLEQAHGALTAFALVMIALAITSCYTAISPIVKAELFPTEIRALGVGLPYALAVSLFGGTAPYVALKLKDLGGESLFYWYVSACIACTLVTSICMRETQRSSRI